MKNSVLIVLLSILISSCGIFRNQKKEKESYKVDSTTTKKTTTNSIDTGSIKKYGKVTLYFEPGAAAYDNQTDLLDYASDLMAATNGLAVAAKNLQDSTKHPIAKPEGGKSPKTKKKGLAAIPGLIAAAFEFGSEEKKGSSINQTTDEKTDLNKSGDSSGTETTANPKVLKTIGVCIIIIIIVVGLYLFLRRKNIV